MKSLNNKQTFLVTGADKGDAATTMAAEGATVGGTAGGWAGARVGAQIGGRVGAAAGPVGAIGGAIAGAVAGAFGGGLIYDTFTKGAANPTNPAQCMCHGECHCVPH